MYMHHMQLSQVFGGGFCPATFSLGHLDAWSSTRRACQPHRTVCSQRTISRESDQRSRTERSRSFTTVPSATAPSQSPGKNWQVGDTVSLVCSRSNSSGFVALADNERVFIPFASFPRLNESGECKSAKEIESEFRGATIDVELQDVRRGQGMIGSAVLPISRRLISQMEGKIAEVRVHEVLRGGLMASHQGLRVFVPWVFVAGNTTVPREKLGGRYLGKTIEVSFMEATSGSITSSMTYHRLQQIECQVETPVEVRVHRYLNGGLEASYEDLRVYIPWRLVPKQRSRTAKELARKYVGKRVTVSFLTATDRDITASLIHPSLAPVSGQVEDLIAVTCTKFSDHGCQPQIRLKDLGNDTMFIPLSNFPSLLPDGRMKTPQELAKEFEGMEINVLLEEAPCMPGQKLGRRFQGNHVTVLARRLLSEKGPATVRVFSQDGDGLTGCLEGVRVHIPWEQVPGAREDANPTHKSSEWKEELAKQYEGKDVTVTLLAISSSGKGLIGSLLQQSSSLEWASS